MSVSPVSIRPATAGDVAAVALIYSAGPAAFDYIFGNSVQGGALPYLQNVFATGKGFFGHQNHHVATVNDKVVGSIALYGSAEYQRMSNQSLIQILRFAAFWQWPRVLSRGLASKKWMPPPRSNMDYVANLGVDPDYRSQGIGRAMLAFGLERARTRGKTRFVLDVAETNPRAQALYEQFGFVLTGTQNSPSPGLVPGARRLEMNIEETA